jgi:flagellin
MNRSLNRLSSGNRIVQPADDAGGLAVSMKLSSTIKNLRAVTYNVSNATSFLQVQDGVIKSSADIVSRMGELKAMHSDVTKNTSDKALYDLEFHDLQGQLYDLAQTKFNGIRVFGDYDSSDTLRTGLVFGTNDTDDDVTLDVYTSENGTSGGIVEVKQTLILSAITLAQDTTANSYTNGSVWDKTNTGAGAGNGEIDGTFSLAHDDSSNSTLSLDNLQAGYFVQTLQNLASARATNGGTVRSLQYNLGNLELQITNLKAANGRIMDVDIARETANLAKQRVLVQSSASMTAQANAANDVALMLIQ